MTPLKKRVVCSCVTMNFPKCALCSPDGMIQVDDWEFTARQMHNAWEEGIDMWKHRVIELEAELATAETQLRVRIVELNELDKELFVLRALKREGGGSG